LASRPRPRAEARRRRALRGMSKPIPAKPDPAYRVRPIGTQRLEVDGLERELRGHVEGEVRFGAADRAMYSTDGSNYRQVPIGAVVPKTVDDVVAAVAVCREHGAPVLSRGGGTSLAGQCCNAAVVIDFSKYLHEILEIDGER